uniref:Corazonin receptor n=1 Tax=Portunus trituberculatus TaxID=210409 RepID=A0A9E8DAD5_PORTR|nr:corazonin receptor [Portunus trituberculatus]
MVEGLSSTETLREAREEAGTDGVEAWEVWSTLSSPKLTEELDLEESFLLGLNLTEAAAVAAGGVSVLAEEQCDALRRLNHSLPNTTACLGHAPQFTPESQVRTIVLAVMAVLSLVGNTATIVSIAREKRRSRSTVYTLIHHLSVADLFVTFACLTTEAVWTFTVQWFAGNFLCKFIKYMQMFSLYLSTFILVLIGVDRFTAVRYPMRRSDTQRHCSYSIIFVWVLSGILSIPQVLVFHVVRGPFIEDFYQCVTYGLYSPAWLEKLYAVFSLVCMFVLPLLILLLTYISTFVTLHKSEKVFRSERTTLGNTCPEFNRRRLLRKAKMRALRISVVIVLAFVICWTPYYMMMIIFLFTTVEDNVAAELQSGIFFFGMSNSLVNPIIYGAFHLCHCHKRRTSFNLIVINRTGSNLQYRASTRASSRFTTYRSSGADLDTSVVNVFEDGVRYSFRRRSSRQKSILAASTRRPHEEGGGRDQFLRPSVRYGRRLKPVGRTHAGSYDPSPTSLSPLACLGEKRESDDEEDDDEEREETLSAGGMEEERKRKRKHHILEVSSNGRKAADDSWSPNDSPKQRNKRALPQITRSVTRSRQSLPHEDGILVTTSLKDLQSHQYNGISLLQTPGNNCELDTQL